MSNACLLRPSKGTKVYTALRPIIGYNKAWKVIGVASNSKFINDYKKSLSFDAEGFPTYESLLNNDYIQKNVIGLSDTAKIKSRDFDSVEDTLENYNSLLEQALKYNRDSSNSNFVAVVDKAGDSNIKINILEKNNSNIEKFKEQYAVSLLIKRLETAVSPLNITRGILNDAEVSAGRVGSTQFNTAMNIAHGAATLVKVANNMEGVNALPEEFCHVIVDSLYDSPLVQRSIKAISDKDTLVSILGEKEYNDLFNFYDGNIDNIAEEALGQILRNKLLEGVKININGEYKELPQIKVPKKAENLITRLKNFILNLFKKVKYQDIAQTIEEVNTLMATLSEDLLNSEIDFKLKRTNSRNRNIIFNSLSERVDRNIELLKGAIEIETKRSKLLHEDPALGRQKIEQLNNYIKNRNESALGVMIYAHKGLKMLQNAKNKLDNINLLSFDDKVNTLITTKTILHSFGTFINTFNEIIEGEKLENDNLFEGKFKIKTKDGEVEIESKELLNDINNLVKSIIAQYTNIAPPIFIKFLKDSLGDNIVDLLLKNRGDAASVEELLQHSSHDISFMDLWLDSMRDSNSPILKMYDKIIKNANDEARLNAISMFKEIQDIRQKVESLGVKDFDFIFEKDKNGNKSGNYVNPEYNWAEYYRQRRIFEKSLDEEFGVNPVGKDKALKDNKRKEWLKDNTYIDSKLNRVPRGDKFPPATLTSTQQKVLDLFLSYKNKIDSLYPETRVSKYKAIQMRKDSTQRLFDGGMNPKKIYENWKENISSEYIDNSDDDLLFGSTTSGLTNFDGTEFMRLPVLYTNRLRNPNELSDDIFGSLYAYAASAAKYEQLEKIVAPLELGRDIIEGKVSSSTKMKVNETKGQKKIVERINHLGQKIDRPAIMSSESNLIRKLDILMETHIYQRYLKDEGTFEVFGNQVKTSKVVSKLLQMGSVAQLGFNFLANLANATTGIAMANIEAASGQYFTAKELASADITYSTLLPEFLKEAYARNKSSKLALFDELFNVRQDFGNNRFHSERSNLLRRIFGKSIQYIGQEAGDHWLYNRIAIAVVKHMKVKYKGKNTTLWDVLAIRDRKDTNLKEMYIPEGVTDMDGNIIDMSSVGKISRRITNINQNLFGIYNEDDMNAANRISLGRILMQYRKWIKPQFNVRFASKNVNLDLEEETEGYYITTYRLAKNIIQELKRGEFQFTVWKDNLSNVEKANIKRSLAEIVQFLALGFIVMALGNGDDKDEPYGLKLARYVSNRLLHETGNLVPSYTMFNELYKTVNNPAAIMGIIGDCSTFVGSLFNPFQWNDELKSGDYKGHSHLYKNFMNLPLPVLSYIKQYNRVYNGLDRSIQFYTNPNVN